MRRVFVLGSTRKPLMPCNPARARELLKNRRARVFRAHPFTIILNNRVQGETQNVELKIDPGSKTTGVALVASAAKGNKVVFAADLSHRGEQIRQSLEQRRAIRRSRRHRKTRYRKPRFNNRTRVKGWLPPSLVSRVENVVNFTQKLINFVPVKEIAVETVRFDTHKMQNPEISGAAYQQGTLQGFEVREYLLEKWGRQCSYCQAKNVPLEIDHIQPRSKGGSDRISNLTIACHRCNQSKGNQDIKVYLKSKPIVLKSVLAQAKSPLKDAAAVNVTRYQIGNSLKALGLSVSFWTGGRTKFNRTRQNYPKAHWIDAACVGDNGHNVYIPKNLKPLQVKACGRGSRQMCRVNRYGFPRTVPKKEKRTQGFQTGDLVKAIVPYGKKKGTYFGRVAVRATGNFNIKLLKDTIQGINHRFCALIQRSDGYSYA